MTQYCYSDMGNATMPSMYIIDHRLTIDGHIRNSVEQISTRFFTNQFHSKIEISGLFKWLNIFTSIDRKLKVVHKVIMNF